MYCKIHKTPENKKGKKIFESFLSSLNILLYSFEKNYYEKVVLKILTKKSNNDLDVILVKLPPTLPRYREYYQQLGLLIT